MIPDPLPPRHRVCLIDLGPGDPGLWTLRAQAYLKKADCLLVDQALPSEVAAIVSVNAEILHCPTLALLKTHPDMYAHIVEALRQGKVVVRLRLTRQGIPGALIEEAEVLRALGIDFELAPGLSAVEAVPAYAGVPLLRREGFPSFRAVVWESSPAGTSALSLPKESWSADETLICLVPPSELNELVSALLQAGRDPEMPVALIERGTRPRQQTTLGTLGHFPRPEISGTTSYVVLVVGSAVYRRESLNWFETRPLFGQTILVTRARRQAGELSALLQAYGADVLETPTIEISPPDSFAPLDAALDALDTYNWILFTSVNGVDAFFARLFDRQKDVRDLKGRRIGAIGPATARAVERYYLRVDLMPEEYRAEAVIPAWERYFGARERLKDLSILLPRAKVARDILPDELRRLGARIDVVEAYQTIIPKDSASVLRAALADRRINGVTFTSSSTVSNLAALLETEDLSAALAGIWIACIGPITAGTAAKFHLTTAIMPQEYTIEALVEAIVKAMNEAR